MDEKINFVIEDKHFDYLAIQRGDISDTMQDRIEWEAAYVDGLYRRFENIKPFLPEKCNGVLDVGSGLGGINAVINKHFGGNISVALLDGTDDAPVVKEHSQTFNNMTVAKDFLKKNGVQKFKGYSPRDGVRTRGDAKYDLIVSFASYCFHYGPMVYMDFVKNHSHKDTVFIFDVRKEKSDWIKQLFDNLGHGEVIWEGKKAVRIAYGSK